MQCILVTSILPSEGVVNASVVKDGLKDIRRRTGNIFTACTCYYIR